MHGLCGMSVYAPVVCDSVDVVFISINFNSTFVISDISYYTDLLRFVVISFEGELGKFMYKVVKQI